MSRGVVLVAIIALLIPSSASAAPFGGQIYIHQPCLNVAIFAAIGPPIRGQFIWTPATRTYRFGPPRYVGQWLLGLSGAPSYCVVSIDPTIVFPGIHIAMMGSSGAPASISLGDALGRGTPPPGAPPAPPPAVCPGSPGPTGDCGGVGRMLIGEVFAMVDGSHGTDPSNEWVELYNATGATVNLSGWRIVWGGATTSLPAATVDAGQIIVVSPATSTRTFWNIPTNVELVQAASSGNMGANGVVRLINPAGLIVDTLSWGSDTSAFTPAAPALRVGHSLVRTSVLSDTDMASDWSDRADPSPGN